MTADAFGALVVGLEYQMVIATTAGGQRLAGCLVGFHSQCSINPPRLLVCLSKRNFTYRVARDAGGLVIHYLGPRDLALAELFGGVSGDEVDKFTRCTWREGPQGLPVIDVERGWVAARILDQFDGGDHVAFLVEPFAGSAHGADRAPLTFQDVRHLEPGHEA